MQLKEQKKIKLTKEKILERFDLFNSGTGSDGIDNWLTEETPDEVFNILKEIKKNPLTFALFNEILIDSKVNSIGEGFYNFYWQQTPVHPYDTSELPYFETDYKIFENNQNKLILSLDHLYWGMYRIFMDGLLFYGNINRAYQDLRKKDQDEIQNKFKDFIFDHNKMALRGKSLELSPIDPKDRHLISEAACKNLDENGRVILIEDLKKSYQLVSSQLINEKKSFQEITIKDIVANLSQVRKEKVENKHLKGKEEKENSKQKFILDFDTTLGSIYDTKIPDPNQLEPLLNKVVDLWNKARKRALKNTELYLAKIGELDVYVAISMRIMEDFEKMANFCNFLFEDYPTESEDIEIHKQLKELNLRYFDPTMSSARGHEDKGLIECLMVKMTKILVLYVGTKESYGKDAEAAMALSLGKPVIFLCEDDEILENFYKNIHPLTRLIRFDTGVAVGALICKDKKIVKELLYRIFYNKMKYRIGRPEKTKGKEERGYYQLREELTNSVVRVQTNDKKLTKAFWDHYPIE